MSASVPSTQNKHASEISWNKRLNDFQHNAREELNHVAGEVGKINMVEFIVGFLMIFFNVTLGGLPVATVAVAVLVLVKLFAKTKYTVPQAGTFLGIIILALGYIAVVSYSSPYTTSGEVTRRLVRIIITIGFAMLIADKRIDIRSLSLGLGIAMVINTIAFYAGIAPDHYNGYLTGWFNDKNVAGMYHAVVPFLLFVFFSKKWERTVTLTFALPTLWLTGSRTSMAAFMIGVLWVLFAQKLNLFFKLVFGVFVGWLFEWLQNTFASNPIFGDRSGTDWFREQIDLASQAKLDVAPWQGMGLGQAVVTLDGGRQMFFHNSYWTLLVEGGWPWLGIIIAVTVLATFIWKQPNQKRLLAAEALVVALSIMSWRLGEVILTAPWAIAVGLALSYLAVPRENQ